MSTPRGRDVILQLIHAYEEEGRLYDQVYEAAAEQQRLLRNGRNPVRLSELIEAQRHLAERIGKIESGIAPLRSYWERIRDSAHGPQTESLAEVLDGQLEDLVNRIHQIVEIERQNTQALLDVPTTT